MDTLEARVKELDCFLDAIPRNSEDKCKLIECGYSSSLWEEVSSLDCLCYRCGLLSIEVQVRVMDNNCASPLETLPDSYYGWFT